jgi:hypothetical protein
VELFVLTELFVLALFVLLLRLGILFRQGIKIEPSNRISICRTMIVKTLQGIPFLCDPVTKTIYAYEKAPTQPLLALGTYNPETETYVLVDNWKALYEPKLQAYRASEKPRTRLPAQPGK